MLNGAKTRTGIGGISRQVNAVHWSLEADPQSAPVGRRMAHRLEQSADGGIFLLI
jgi:hypothetical protein